MKIVILAGGAGTRLWPMSAGARPKQFQTLVSDRSMLQETYDRFDFANPEDIYIATNAQYVELVQKQLPDVPAENIIAEPSMQDTGPCIGLAAALIAKKDPEAVMAVVYADHLVQDKEEFVHKLKVSADIAQEQNTLNIIEVKAKYPNVHLGYVRIGRMLEERDDVEVYAFEEFKEKPDLETAKKFVASYSYLWNTGFYVWRVDRILGEFQKHLPKTYDQLIEIQQGADIRDHYPKCDKISIDYGIMEKVDPADVRIIPADLGWSDIGTWTSLHDELARYPEDNVIKGKVVTLDCEGSLIYNTGGPTVVAALGLKDMIVVQGDGFLLVTSKKESPKLKELLKKVAELPKNRDQAEMKEVPKPWGKELWFANQPGYVGKILYINKGHRYSLQYHERKTETQYLLSGKIRFLIGENKDSLKEVILEPGDKLDVYPGIVHRAEALEDAEIMEVSTNYLEDVVKLADDYGRSGRGNDLERDAELARKASE